jgi:hypothetical protein
MSLLLLVLSICNQSLAWSGGLKVSSTKLLKSLSGERQRTPLGRSPLPKSPRSRTMLLELPHSEWQHYTTSNICLFHSLTAALIFWVPVASHFQGRAVSGHVPRSWLSDLRFGGHIFEIRISNIRWDLVTHWYARMKRSNTTNFQLVLLVSIT